jgi:predicted dehydrogenase
MRKAKLGLIGCGGIARHSHLPAIGELAKRGALDFVAVCDVDKNRAKEIGEQFGVPYYTDAEEMMEKHKNIDVIDNCTGDYTHHSIAKLAAEHKMHPIVEKPMALTLPCCDVMIDACRKNGVHFEVAENYFRMPVDRIIIKMINEGLIGDVMRVYMIDPVDEDEEKPLWVLGTHSGVCLDMGVHRMSQVRLYASSEPRKIVGLTKQLIPAKGKVYEDWGHALIDFESGAAGVCECSAVGEKVSYRQVVGTKGTIRDNAWGGGLTVRAMVGGQMKDVPIERVTHKVDGMDALVKIIVHADADIVYENPFKEFALDDWHIGVAEEIMSIANAALYDKKPEYGIEGRKDVEMCMALYESSLKDMMPIELPITKITSYEQRVHRDYEKVFGHSPIDV